MSTLPPFDYLRARSVDQVLEALQQPGARIFAGGTDLLVALAERRPGVADVRVLVDIKAVEDAGGVAVRSEALHIGAATTAHELAIHPLVARHAAALGEAAAVTASPALRHRATVGGNLATPHPAGDVATALLALGATAEIATAGGGRAAVPVDRLLDPGARPSGSEFIVAVRVPLGGDSAYEKMGRRRGFSRAQTAVAVCLRGETMRVAVAGPGERPRLVGAPTDDGDPLDDVSAALLARARRRIGGEP